MKRKKNVRVWMSDGSDGDMENVTGSWPLNNIQLANSLKLKGYDFHFRFGVSMHLAIAQGARSRSAGISDRGFGGITTRRRPGRII